MRRLDEECGEAVSVEHRISAQRDGFGNERVEYGEPVEVRNVLVVPGAPEGMDASRPEGVVIACTLHFPKTYTGNLRGARITLGGQWAGVYHVVGVPLPYPPELTPTQWNRVVMLEAHDG